MFETRVFFFRELEVDFVYVNNQRDLLHEEIKEDCLRRDLTINSLYFNLTNYIEENS